MSQVGVAAGNLRERIVVQVDATASNPVTDAFGQVIEGWQNVGAVWAEFNPTGGEEFFSSQQLTAQRRGTFTLRQQLAITPEAHRILFGGETWDILRVDPLQRSRLVVYAVARSE